MIRPCTRFLPASQLTVAEQISAREERTRAVSRWRADIARACGQAPEFPATAETPGPR